MAILDGLGEGGFLEMARQQIEPVRRVVLIGQPVDMKGKSLVVDDLDRLGAAKPLDAGETALFVAPDPPSKHRVRRRDRGAVAPGGVRVKAIGDGDTGAAVGQGFHHRLAVLDRRQ